MTRAAFNICDRVVLDGRMVTVVPTSPQVPRDEINVMDATGSVRTVRVDRLQREDSVVKTARGTCAACQHEASRTSEPWNNQYQCAKGCRCTMQGCCPSAAGTSLAASHRDA